MTREEAIAAGWYISVSVERGQDTAYELVSPDHQWYSETCLTEEEAWGWLQRGLEEWKP